MPDFTLLHTNDFHGQLSGAQADTLKRRVASLNGQGILLDAGDAISAGNITFRSGGEPILDAMSDIGYAAMTVGNREFHFSRAGFHSKLSRAKFPILCANVRANRGPNRTDEEQVVDGNNDPPVRPWIEVLLPNGMKIVIIGVTVPMITERMLVRKVSSYVFDEPISAAARMVPRLIESRSPDLMVALTHIGIGQDRLLAEQAPGLDLIIGGHTHVILPEGERVGDTLIVQAGSHARLLGTVEVNLIQNTRPNLTAKVEPL